MLLAPVCVGILTERLSAPDGPIGPGAVAAVGTDSETRPRATCRNYFHSAINMSDYTTLIIAVLARSESRVDTYIQCRLGMEYKNELVLRW